MPKGTSMLSEVTSTAPIMRLSVLVMKERIFLPGNQQTQVKIELTVAGDAIAINLDKKKSKNSTQSERLFHFLDDNGQPWSKRCDFVVFHLYRGRIGVACFEFKWETLPVEKIIEQLKASESWCRSLHSIVKHYTAKRRRLNLTKYVISAHPDPSPYLDDDDYLRRDHSIKHYHYNTIDGMALQELGNTNVETIS
jgi:hypothetical protein